MTNIIDFNKYKRIKYGIEEFENFKEPKITKLYTGLTIEYLEEIIFYQEIPSQHALINPILYKTYVVDKKTFINAFHSIEYNGARQEEVETEEDKIFLMIDYVNIEKTENDYWIMLSFDEYEEQEYSLVYKMEKEQIEILKNTFKNDNYHFLDSFLMIMGCCY